MNDDKSKVLKRFLSVTIIGLLILDLASLLPSIIMELIVIDLGSLSSGFSGIHTGKGKIAFNLMNFQAILFLIFILKGILGIIFILINIFRKVKPHKKRTLLLLIPSLILSVLFTIFAIQGLLGESYLPKGIMLIPLFIAIGIPCWILNLILFKQSEQGITYKVLLFVVSVLTPISVYISGFETLTLILF